MPDGVEVKIGPLERGWRWKGKSDIDALDDPVEKDLEQRLQICYVEEVRLKHKAPNWGYRLGY